MVLSSSILKGNGRGAGDKIVYVLLSRSTFVLKGKAENLLKDK